MTIEALFKVFKSELRENKLDLILIAATWTLQIN